MEVLDCTSHVLFAKHILHDPPMVVNALATPKFYQPHVTLQSNIKLEFQLDISTVCRCISIAMRSI